MSELIRIRDDDILIPSSGHKDSFKRFKQVHGWICESTKCIHVPTILVTEIQEFPQAIEYIKQETEAGRMAPEIHGLQHIDYGKLTGDEIREHLKICKDFLFKNFNVEAKFFYTPWGASSELIEDSAKQEGLIMVDCSAIIQLKGRHGAIQRLKDGHPASVFYGREIFCHFWEGGSRLKRFVESVKYGTYELAKEANEGNGLFGE